MEREIGAKHDYLTTRHTFQIYGLCADCREENNRREGSRKDDLRKEDGRRKAEGRRIV